MRKQQFLFFLIISSFVVGNVIASIETSEKERCSFTTSQCSFAGSKEDMDRKEQVNERDVPIVQSVDPKTLQSWLSQGDAVLIDVREKVEYENESIPNSIHMPLQALDPDKIADFSSKKITFHCRSGKRSLIACQKTLGANPFLTIYNLEGGILAWEEAGLDVNKSVHQTIPIDRQVHIVVGFLLVFSVILGYFIHRLFFLIPLFIGIGLLVHGFSGWCGMAQVLYLLPWNK